MMAKASYVYATLFVCAASMHAASAASIAKGTFGVSSYYVSATASGGGSCAFPAGTYLSSEYIYPGPSKPGAVERSYINGAAGAYILETMFPTTPAAGATTWSGPVTATFLPGGTPYAGTFSSTFTIVDANAYVAKSSYTYAAGSGSCTYVVQEVGIRQSK